MDTFIVFFKIHLFNILIAGAVLLCLKLTVSILHKGFSFTKVFLSFFIYYDKIEIESIGNRKRAAYMWWNNVLNFSIYIWLLLIAFTLIVTINSTDF